MPPPLPQPLPPVEGLGYDFALEKRILADYEARLARDGLGTLGLSARPLLFFFLFFVFN